MPFGLFVSDNSPDSMLAVSEPAAAAVFDQQLIHSRWRMCVFGSHSIDDNKTPGRILRDCRLKYTFNGQSRSDNFTRANFSIRMPAVAKSAMPRNPLHSQICIIGSGRDKREDPEATATGHISLRYFIFIHQCVSRYRSHEMAVLWPKACTAGTIIPDNGIMQARPR